MNKTVFQERTDKTVKNVESRAKKAWRHFNRYTLKRFASWQGAWRFVALWVLLIAALVGALIFRGNSLGSIYSAPAPVAGGNWREGMSGATNNLNPLYASSDVDMAVDNLVFDGLLKYDSDNTNKLGFDLAQSIDVSQDGLTHTVHLRHGVKWQDGTDFTSADVVYTFKTIQNPSAGTPLSAGWQGIDISAPDKYTVIFKLPAPFAPFDYYLTTAILPSHLLSGTDPSELRTSSFNSHPIGTGPFVLHNINTFSDHQEIDFVRNDSYFAGPAKLQTMSIYAYNNPSHVVNDFKNHFLTAAVIDSRVDADKLTASDVDSHQIPFFKAGFAFFKTDSSLLSDSSLRQALALGTDQKSLINPDSVNGLPLQSPLLPDQIGYTNQSDFKFNPSQAEQILTQDGWLLGRDGVREKNGQDLILKLATSDAGDYPAIANSLAKQWQKIGVKVNVSVVSDSQLQQSVILPRDYDVLLYSISLGADPDSYAYWHSSQAVSGHFNLSDYKSPYVDTLLETARTRMDDRLRAVKYQAFAKQFAVDAPAVPLYRLTYEYVVRRPAQAGEFSPEVDPSDRFWDVTSWTSHVQPKYKTP